MTTYGWYPLNTSSSPFTWTPTGNWNDPTFWADVTSLVFPPPTGTVPGAGDTAFVGSANSILRLELRIPIRPTT